MRQRLRRHAEGFAWTGFDQALSSISNVIVSLALARSGGAEALGVFTIAFAAYLIALVFLRSLVSEPVLTVPVASTGVPDETEPLGLTTALTYLVPASLTVVAVGSLTGRFEIVVIGLALPFVGLQDFFRYLFFRRNRPELAALLDATWVVTSVIGWPLIVSRGSPSIALVVWAAGGALGVVVGFAVSGVRFAGLRRSLTWWWREIRPLGGYLALDGLLFTFFVQITLLGLAAILGNAELGTWRGAQIILGPVGLTLTAFNVFALPRLSSSRNQQTPRVAFLVSAGAAILAAVSVAVLWIVAPVLVPLLYGDQLDVPRILILAVGTVMTVGALNTGPTLLLKARRRGAPIVVGRIAAGVIGVPVVLSLAAAFGLVPAVWGSNVATLVNLLVLTTALFSNRRPNANR